MPRARQLAPPLRHVLWEQRPNGVGQAHAHRCARTSGGGEAHRLWVWVLWMSLKYTLSCSSACATSSGPDVCQSVSVSTRVVLMFVLTLACRW